MNQIFKQDFYPREHVIAVLDNGEKADGVVREKTSFNERYAHGVFYPATSRYLVSIEADPSTKREAADVPVEAENLYRDRRVFSKQLLRSFLKGALQKESWHGAPFVGGCRITTLSVILVTVSQKRPWAHDGQMSDTTVQC